MFFKGLTVVLILLCGANATMVDMSHIIQENVTRVIPGLRPFKFDVIHAAYRPMKDGGKTWVIAEELSMHAHQGTHMDAPNHMGFTKEASDLRWGVDQIPVERFMGPLRVINVVDKAKENYNYQIQVSDIARHEEQYGKIPPGSIVVMKSGWSERYHDRKLYFGEKIDEGLRAWPGWGGEAGRFLAEYRGVYGVGVDGPSLDHGITRDLIGHKMILTNNMYGIEMVANVHKVPEAGALAVVLPMKTYHGSGGPCRMVAIWGDDTFISGANSSKYFIMTILSALIVGVYAW